VCLKFLLLLLAPLVAYGENLSQNAPVGMSHFAPAYCTSHFQELQDYYNTYTNFNNSKKKVERISLRMAYLVF
jgi:hypothetical protein